MNEIVADRNRSYGHRGRSEIHEFAKDFIPQCKIKSVFFKYVGLNGFSLDGFE